MTSECVSARGPTWSLTAWLAGLVLAIGFTAAAQEESVAGLDDEGSAASVRDPMERVNRGLYVFNDKLYFWALQPASKGYAKAVPEKARKGIGRALTNLGMPRRGVNCLLQGDVTGTVDEVGRFVINSTIGCLGFMDLAESRCGLQAHDEDFGQTLGRYGVGYGCYLTLPFLGPSNPRDTVGWVADTFLDPVTYLVQELPVRVAVKAGDRVNDTSLRLGDYEKSKETALDHYIWLRETYTQYRDEQIRR